MVVPPDGERTYTRVDYTPVFGHRPLKYVTPAILRTGGVNEVK